MANEWLSNFISETITADGKILLAVQFCMSLHGFKGESKEILLGHLNSLSLFSPAIEEDFGIRVPQLAIYHWRLMKHVQAAFDLRTKAGVVELAKWYVNLGHQELCATKGLVEWFAQNPDATPYLRNELGLSSEETEKTLSNYRRIENQEPKKGNLSPKYDIIVFGFAGMTSGIGEDARRLFESLTASGMNATLCDIGGYNSTHRENQEIMSDFHISELEHPGRVHIFVAPATELFNVSLQFPSTFKGTFKTIGFFQWELDRWPEKLNFCLELVDEIWTISEHSAKAFRGATRKTVIKMPIATTIPDLFRLKELASSKVNRCFTFFFMYDPFSYVDRKNPEAVIQTFKQAFPPAEDHRVRLVVKILRDADISSIRNLAGNDQRIEFVCGTLERGHLLDLLANANCFVSLHRAEGYGRGIAEAMFLGVPCVVTKYSGNMDFCNDKTAFCVPYRLVKIKKNQYPYSEGLDWAEPDLNEAAAILRRVYSSDGEVKKTTQNAMELVSKNYSVEACGAKYCSRIKEIT